MFPSLLFSDDNRTSIYSFDNYIEKKEISECLEKRDYVRYSSAIYDTANQKISTFPYGVKINRPKVYPVKNNYNNSLLDNSLELMIDASTSHIFEESTLLDEQTKNRMLSTAFEFSSKAKESEDPIQSYYEAARLFDKLEIYDRAIKYYLKAIKPADPVEIVDNKQLPMTELELRKLERLGKPQKTRYLKAREDKRNDLILKEKSKQERRIQDSHCRLFRIFLYQSLNQNQNHHQNQQHFSSNNLKHEHQKNELITKSHAHLRAAFRAIHPDRPAAHVAILKYTHSVLTTYLPPSTAEDGIYLHATSGSAGILQEAHILILRELIDFDETNVDYFTTLAKRYAEKCEFEESRNMFKRARDVQEANRTPRYASNITLKRHQGLDYDHIAVINEMTTTMVPPNTSSLNIGTDMDRTKLLDGKKLAIVKIPIIAFGEGNQEDSVAKRELGDYTSFSKCHEGSETRIYLPPSIGWKKHLQIVDAIAQSTTK